MAASDYLPIFFKNRLHWVGRPQMNSSCLEHAFMIWFRSANSHTGPQLHRCIRGRTDGSIRLRADLLQKPLALGGASTDEFTVLVQIGCRASRLARSWLLTGHFAVTA
jgi:hypothetical protein